MCNTSSVCFSFSPYAHHSSHQICPSSPDWNSCRFCYSFQLKKETTREGQICYDVLTRSICRIAKRQDVVVGSGAHVVMVQCLRNYEGQILDSNDDSLYKNLPRQYIKASNLFVIDRNSERTPSLSTFLNATSILERSIIEEQFAEQYLCYVREEMARIQVQSGVITTSRKHSDAKEVDDDGYDVSMKNNNQSRMNNINNINNKKRKNTTNSIIEASNVLFQVYAQSFISISIYDNFC